MSNPTPSPLCQGEDPRPRCPKCGGVDLLNTDRQTRECLEHPEPWCVDCDGEWCPQCEAEQA